MKTPTSYKTPSMLMYAFRYKGIGWRESKKSRYVATLLKSAPSLMRFLATTTKRRIPKGLPDTYYTKIIDL